MYIDDTISTVKSLVGFTDVTDICRSVMYTEFNTLIVEIKNLSMEVNFMDSSDGLGRSKNNIGADTSEYCIGRHSGFCPWKDSSPDSF